MSFSSRIARARARMAELDVDVVLCSVGADLPYLTGYEAMPLERLTMLVLPRAGDAHLVVPRLEAPRVVAQPDVFEVVPWEETDDPDRARWRSSPVRRRGRAISDQTWARFVLDLQRALPSTAFSAASEVIGPLARGQGRGGDRRAAPGRARGRRRRGRDAVATVRGSDRARRAPRARRAHARRRSRARELRDRRGGRARRQPAPRAFARPDRSATASSCCATSAARCSATAPTSPACSTWASRPPRSASCTTCSWTRRRPVCAPPRSGRRAKPSTPPRARRHRRCRVRRVLRASRRSRHRQRGARGSVHGRRATRSRSKPATRSASSPASTCPVGSACGSRTSSSRRPAGPVRLNDARARLAVVD